MAFLAQNITYQTDRRLHDVAAYFLAVSGMEAYPQLPKVPTYPIIFLKGFNSPILIHKITELLPALSLVDKCVQARVCKRGCDVLDSRVFLKIIL